MFGYVTANKSELKMREFSRYKAFYCGLCRRLGKNNGAVSRLTLSYDMTFLILLLSSLYEPKEQQERHRCLIHPGKKQWMIYNQITDYASDMNVLLSCYHFQDDWVDERSIAGFCGAKVFAKRAKKITGLYPRQAKVIQEQLGRLAELEQKEITDPDAISRPFGELMSELFVYQEDAFQDILRSFGFYLGKYIYLLDAFMDLEKDLKKGSFNPFRESADREDFEESARQMLEGTIRQAVAEFEKLPLEQDLPILRNILYEGVKLPLMRGENDDKRSI